MNIPSYFEEDAYLFYNADLAAAVADGRVLSGYHHWLYQGWKELRPGAPASMPPIAQSSRLGLKRGTMASIYSDFSPPQAVWAKLPGVAGPQ